MKAQIDYIRYTLDSSFWFVPGIMIVAAIGLSFAVVAADRALIDASIDVSGWVYTATPDGARQLLTTIASSIITVTSLVFSMTLIALTLASQQLGPRLLENFMRNRANQFVLGFFVATFVYALLVLRTISDLDEAHFVPSCAIMVAIGMSIASFAILIFFIHHVAQSIQADTVVANVAGSLDRIIDSYFSERNAVGDSETSGRWPADFDDRAAPVCAPETGYIQTVDVAALKRLAEEKEIVLQLDCRPGHFIVEGCPAAYVYPGEAISEALENQLFANFVIGPKRTPAQDVEYEIRVMAEIAVRALSPGINDYYTATTCVDHLTAALVSIARHKFPSADIHGESGGIVLRTVPPDFAGLLDTAFNDIRQSAGGNTAVTVRLLEALTVIAGACRTEAQNRAVARHADMIGRSVAEFIFEDRDRADAEARLETLRQSLVEDK